MIKKNYLSFPEYDLKEILKSSQENKLVFFIGSGFSKFSETELIKIPNWSELIDELKEDLNLPNENDFLKIAQLYFLKYGQHSYTQKVKSTIKKLEPSAFHRNLFDIAPHYIITTNWDDLLEKTAQDMGYAYDLISSDVDLAQSQLDKKIIKMHGDFRQHNFVFKEDDYLQYSQNFPLIENYIKGIFSTSTIVFLGYSYSDYDLKQIVSWVSNISKATPKKYLLQKSFDDAQADYLKNHGISLLTPINYNNSYQEVYFNFFNDLKTVRNQNELLKKVFVSVESQIKKIEDDLTISLPDQMSMKAEINNFLQNKINKTLDSKFIALSQYKALLPEQVSRKLTNCTIDYNVSTGITLIAHDNFLTGDYDIYNRKINNMFFDNILNLNGELTKKFLSILDKSFITKIEYGSKVYNLSEKPSNFKNELLDKINFNYSRNSLEIRFINKEYHELLDDLMSKVKHYIKERNYVLSTIYMANFDIIYGIVKQSSITKLDEAHEISKEILSKLSPFDYKEKIIDFPRELQKDLQDLVGILEFNEIYKAYYRFNIESQKNLGYAQVRKEGGIAFSDNEFSIRSKLYSYVYFILGNDLFIEEFSEIKKLFESNIIASLEHYLIDDKFHINIMDLFMLIKYCAPEKIKGFASKLLNDNNLLNINMLSAREIYHIKKYLLLALKNTCNLFDMQNKNFMHSTSIDRWLNNILLLIGFARWSKSEIKQIIDYIIHLLEHRTHNVVIYENAQYFLTVNNRLYNKFHPDILRLLDVVLEKIAHNQFNGVDQQIIHLNTLRNIYTISANNKYSYNNTKAIKTAILVIEEKSIEFKKFITANLLLNIKNIGSDEVNDIIDGFVNNHILVLPCTTPKDYIERLLLIANGYPAPNDFVARLKSFISSNIPVNIATMEFIKARVETELPNLLDFLIKERNQIEFQDVLDTFNEKMKKV
ncbi:SIR2 family protein [Citrobacter braakii]|uniref:SIR2 family protein n=1 Tax=Citrobacter braakii TaxID=57706 RepID=UPI0039755E0E